MSREDTIAARSEARATVRFRPLDYDRLMQPKQGELRPLYLVSQGVFVLGTLVQYPFGNFGFILNETLKARFELEHEFAKTPYNAYRNMLTVATEDSPTAMRYPRVFDTEEQLRETLWAFRDILFSWMLDVVIATPTN